MTRARFTQSLWPALFTVNAPHFSLLSSPRSLLRPSEPLWLLFAPPRPDSTPGQPHRVVRRVKFGIQRTSQAAAQTLTAERPEPSAAAIVAAVAAIVAAVEANVAAVAANVAAVCGECGGSCGDCSGS